MFYHKIFLCDNFIEQLSIVLITSYRRLVELLYRETQKVASLLQNELEPSF